MICHPPRGGGRLAWADLSRPLCQSISHSIPLSTTRYPDGQKSLVQGRRKRPGLLGDFTNPNDLTTGSLQKLADGRDTPGSLVQFLALKFTLGGLIEAGAWGASRVDSDLDSRWRSKESFADSRKERCALPQSFGEDVITFEGGDEGAIPELEAGAIKGSQNETTVVSLQLGENRFNLFVA